MPLEDTKEREGVVVAPAGAYRESFDRRPFRFAHTLAGSPLFELPRLVELSQTLLAQKGGGSVNWRGGDSAIDSRWKYVPPKGQAQSVREAIENIDASGSWILLYAVQTDPAYRALLDEVMADLARVSGRDLGSEVTWKDAYIFLASPSSVTPYHIDHEVTFLFQVRGERTAQVWLPDDRTVLSEAELEDYYLGRLGAAVYRSENQDKAGVYSLPAGQGVHHPSCAPHAYQNGAGSYSVALGVHFCLRDHDRRARVYQVNGCLRRLGLAPTPPGLSPWRDRAKIRALGLFDARHPGTKNELIRSGIQRLAWPLRVIPGATQKL